MIVSFSVANFRSFSSEETFSMVASNRLAGRHEDHAVPIPGSDERVLRTAVLYGANGAGKSNLFKALSYLKAVALDTRARNSGTGREAFRFGEATDAPTTFDLQFIAGNKLYRFGMKIDDERILEEWLVLVDGNREKPLYERTTTADGAVSIRASGLDGIRVRALATVGGPQNQCFLATLQANLEPPDFGDELRDVIDWFRNGLRLIAPSDIMATLGHSLARHPDLLSFAGDFLKASSTGVDHLQISRGAVTQEEMTRLLTDRYRSRGVERPADQNGTAIFTLGEGDTIVATRSSGMERITIQSAHEHQPGNVVSMDLGEESDGTRRLLDLIPALHDLHTRGGVYFIDEIDRSLHPMLVRNFVEHFLRSCDRSQRQLIMTTHESNLLDQELLRRDEIWFAEKDPAGATHIYSLMDFKVRNDLEIRKHYLQGRFGAVPYLGDPGRLPAETNQTA
jgi:AAA15 family ATPase/GTPase